MIKQLVVNSIESSIPSEYLQVLIWHKHGVDRGQRYGSVYRLADYSEDQLYVVTHWAEIPDIRSDYVSWEAPADG